MHVKAQEEGNQLTRIDIIQHITMALLQRRLPILCGVEKRDITKENIFWQSNLPEDIVLQQWDAKSVIAVCHNHRPAWETL